MSKGMTTCKICGRDFALMFEEHYVAQDPQKVGAIANLVNTDRAFEYDAFDCPHCGCQNVMQGRKPVYLGQDVCPCDFGICDECETKGTAEHLDHDGCLGCKYADLQSIEEPCKSCRCNHEDKYERENRDD